MYQYKDKFKSVFKLVIVSALLVLVIILSSPARADAISPKLTTTPIQIAYVTYHHNVVHHRHRGHRNVVHPHKVYHHGVHHNRAHRHIRHRGHR